MNLNDVENLFPKLNEIKNNDLKKKVVDAWSDSIQTGGWKIEELKDVPFTLLIEDTKINLIEHTNNVTNTAINIAKSLEENYDNIKVDYDILIAGALLHDVAKLMEYDKKDGKVVKSEIGKYLRHPIGGAALAGKHGLPDKIIHIIGSHSKEGNFAKRTIEAIIIHHADFLNFEPFLK